jgi:hypothetical protein
MASKLMISTRIGCLVSTAIMPFIPIDTTGTVVGAAESCVPTEWEKTHLLMSEDSNPSQDVVRNGDQRDDEVQINAIISGDKAQKVVEDRRTIERVRSILCRAAHNLMSCTFNPRDFTERLVSAVNIATAYRKDVDQRSDERKASRTLNLSSPDDPIVTKYMEERKASSIVSNE